MGIAFDPLSYENLGASISRALDDQPIIPLAELTSFNGAGVYALYYSGDFPSYVPIAAANRSRAGSWAIYIGRAEAENHRKGDPDQQSVLEGPKLFKRINEHKKSIVQADNLNVEDFSVRYLVVAPAWVPLAEIIAIRLHKPVWNSLVDGFGNHDPGSGRHNSVISRWDALHPGRRWALNLQPRRESSTTIQTEVLEYLRVHMPSDVAANVDVVHPNMMVPIADLEVFGPNQGLNSEADST